MKKLVKESLHYFILTLKSLGTKIKQTHKAKAHLLLVYRPTDSFTDHLTVELTFPLRMSSRLRRRWRRPRRFRSSWPPCEQTGCLGSPPATPRGSSSFLSPQYTCGHGSWAPRTAPSCVGKPDVFKKQPKRKLYSGRYCKSVWKG